MRESVAETKRGRWARFLEILINVVRAGKSGNVTYRKYLSEAEEEIIRKKRKERSKSELEREYDTAK